jgi:hypothetical protein
VEVLCQDCGPIIPTDPGQREILITDHRKGCWYQSAPEARLARSRPDPAPLRHNLMQALSPDERSTAFVARMDSGHQIMVALYQAQTRRRRFLDRADRWRFVDTAPQQSRRTAAGLFHFRPGWIPLHRARPGARRASRRAIPLRYHFHTACRSPVLVPFNGMDMFVGRNEIFPRV